MPRHCYLVAAAAVAIILAASCRKDDVGLNTGAESCFDLGGGVLQCVPAMPGAKTMTVDVNGDGVPDRFVCTNHKRGHEDGDDDHAKGGDDDGDKGGSSGEAGESGG